MSKEGKWGLVRFDFKQGINEGICPLVFGTRKRLGRLEVVQNKIERLPVQVLNASDVKTDPLRCVPLSAKSVGPSVSVVYPSGMWTTVPIDDLRLYPSLQGALSRVKNPLVRVVEADHDIFLLPKDNNIAYALYLLMACESPSKS